MRNESQRRERRVTAQPLIPIANARMYSVSPQIGAAWKALLDWAIQRAGLNWRVIDHDAPAPLAELWAREDLGCAMMCGLPYSQRRPRPALVAAPIPSPVRYGGRPVYFTDIAVRADAPLKTLEDTFGGVVGYTLDDSMSGCVALWRHLLPYREERGRPLFRETVGGLLNARGVIDALDAGTIDVGPLDSYAHDLLRRSEPDFAAKVRIVATTVAAPIPPFVATAPLADSDIARLRAALDLAGRAQETSVLRDTLLLAGFATPGQVAYSVLDEAVAASRSFAPTR